MPAGISAICIMLMPRFYQLSPNLMTMLARPAWFLSRRACGPTDIVGRRNEFQRSTNSR
jgi:hypothetical protein